MMWEDDEFVRLYEELVSVSDEICMYYDIDKVKWYSVYIWTKESEDDEWGDNVFDIQEDEIVFYVEDHMIIEEAKPIIKKIQAKLKEISLYVKENADKFKMKGWV